MKSGPSLWACPKVPWSLMPCPFVLGHSCSQLGDLTDVPACEVPRERRQSVVPPDGLTTTKHRKALQRAKLQLPQNASPSVVGHDCYVHPAQVQLPR